MQMKEAIVEFITAYFECEVDEDNYGYSCLALYIVGVFRNK